ncbi:MAG: phospholipid carrier-dependent glycosyltransferase, partial [Candidatus Hinthialibacter sp.]
EIDGRRVPWHQDEMRMMCLLPCLIIPVTGLVMAAHLPHWIVDLSRYQGTMPILIVGRAVTAYAGALTVLLAYLIGRDAYNRAAGLIAAAMLATAMLHVQTSHFATTDVILGFLTTAAVYCFLKISQKPRMLWYALGAVCTGFAVGAKWSGVTLPGILFVAHAIATLGDQKNGKTGRWIHVGWLIAAGLILAHFLLAARSVTPPVNETLAAFRDFYWTYVWWIAGFGGLAFLASIYLLILRKRWHGGKVGWLRPAIQIYRPWVWLGLAVAIGLAAFMAAQPMAYFDAKEFGRSISEQAALNATGERPVVYTQQYRHTPPVFYSLDNLFYPSLDWLTAFFVVGGCLYALVRLYQNKNSSSDLLLSAWVIPSFLLYSCVHSKFPRYMDAVLPVMMVMGARWMVDLARIQPSVYAPSLPSFGEGWRKAARRFGRWGGALALVCGLIYGVSYVGIYNRPHTLVQTEKWLKENSKPGAKITMQSWDNGIGIHIEHSDQLGIHDRGEQDLRNPRERVRYLSEMLDRFDYVVLQSKRGYGTTLQNPDLFPITNQFLRALFAEQLGFRIAKVIDNPPRFLGWKFYADEEDETARIYDHPKIVIFEKTQNFTQDQLSDLIFNPPEWVSQITKEEILTLRDGHAVYGAPPGRPLLSWMAMVYLLGIIGFILLFPIAAFLPDRGYGVSKIIGLALFGWLSWILASTGAMPVSQMQGLLVLA